MILRDGQHIHRRNGGGTLVALYTRAVLARPWSDAANVGFRELSGAIENDLALHPPEGLIRTWHLGVHPEPASSDSVSSLPEPGGTPVPTLSAWADLGSAFWFSYRSALHRRALGRRREWFARTQEPIYVLWHAPDLESITVKEGEFRLGLLGEKGPTVAAFDFLHPFDDAGEPIPPAALRGIEPEAQMAGVFPLAFHKGARARPMDRSLDIKVRPDPEPERGRIPERSSEADQADQAGNASVW